MSSSWLLFFPLSSDNNPTGRLVTKTNIAIYFATVACVGSRLTDFRIRTRQHLFSNLFHYFLLFHSRFKWPSFTKSNILPSLRLHSGQFD